MNKNEHKKYAEVIRKQAQEAMAQGFIATHDRLMIDAWNLELDGIVPDHLQVEETEPQEETS